MSRRDKLQLAIGLLFLTVGVVNAVRTEYYIQQTQPRDAAQEQCVSQTLKALKERNEAVFIYLKNEDESQAMKNALADRVNSIRFPDCSFGAR